MKTLNDKVVQSRRVNTFQPINRIFGIWLFLFIEIWDVYQLNVKIKDTVLNY